MSATLTSHECRKVEPDLVEYAYGGLEPIERARIASELAACPACRGVMADFLAVRDALDSLAPGSKAVGRGSRREPMRTWLAAAGLLVAIAAGGFVNARTGWLNALVGAPAETPLPVVAERLHREIPVPSTPRLPSDPMPESVHPTSTEVQLARIQRELEAVIHLQLALQRLTSEAQSDPISHRTIPGALDR